MCIGEDDRQAQPYQEAAAFKVYTGTVKGTLMRDKKAPAAGCWTGPAGSTAFTGCGTIAAESAEAITGPLAELVVSTCPAASTRHAQRAVTTRGLLMEPLCTLSAMRILGL